MTTPRPDIAAIRARADATVGVLAAVDVPSLLAYIEAIEAEHQATVERWSDECTRHLAELNAAQNSLAEREAEHGEVIKVLRALVHFARNLGCNRKKPGPCECCEAIDAALSFLKRTEATPPKEPTPVWTQEEIGRVKAKADELTPLFEDSSDPPKEPAT